VALVLLK